MGGPLCNSAAPGQSIRDQNSLQLQIVWSSALGMMMHQQKEEVQWRELEWLELKLQRTNQQPNKGRTGWRGGVKLYYCTPAAIVVLLLIVKHACRGNYKNWKLYQI